ncbi:MAG TPA: HNH endonuclease signature motif containing protein [Streptosporangiaceae bacterium]|nr:HNH endonuclease signature motif containing protein [Streptosporangiaceae bacterium]
MSQPTAAVRKLVWERDGGRCVACGLILGDGVWWSMQHRMRRAAGGNLPSNLILLCGSATSPGCHRNAEDRTPEAERLGYWIRANTKPPLDPALIPVFYYLDDSWYLLSADGTRTLCPAPEIAA